MNDIQKEQVSENEAVDASLENSVAFQQYCNQRMPELKEKAPGMKKARRKESKVMNRDERGRVA